MFVLSRIRFPKQFKKNNLYAFSNSQIGLLAATTNNSNTTANKMSNVKSNCLFNIWHNILSRASTQIVKHVLAQCNILYRNKSNLHFCSTCCLGKIHKLLE